MATARRARPGLLPPGAWVAIRRRIGEAAGLTLLVLATALLLAWLSYHPTDPSPLRAAPGPVKNLIGPVGANVTDVGIQAFGWGYLVSVAILVAWGWRLFVQRGLTRPALRLALFPASVLAAAVAFGAVPLDSMPELPGGPGGAAGRMLFVHLEPLGPVLGGVSTGTLGLAAAVVAGVLLVFTLGFSPREWRDAGVEGAIGMARGWRALASGAQIGWRKAKVEVERAAEQIREAVPSTSPLDPRIERPASMPAPTPQPAPKPAAQPVAVPPIVGLQGERDEARLRRKPEPASATAALLARVVRTKAEPKLALLEYQPPQPSVPVLPPLDLLTAPRAAPVSVDDITLAATARQLEGVLADFGVRGDIVKVRPGPVVTLYELEPAAGTKSARVVALADDIARAMSAVAVRIAVIPGRTVIGIELPNPQRDQVLLQQLLATPAWAEPGAALPLILGKDIGGEPVVADLARMPHLLIAGTTGSGKSVGLNAMILSLLYRLPAERCRLILIDPKMLEFSAYNGIPHLLTPVVTDPKRAVVALKWVVREMEQRYRAMSRLGVRNIEGYNAKIAQLTKDGTERTRRVQVGFDAAGQPLFEDQSLDLEDMPFIVVVVDEMADLMMVAGKEIEAVIQRLAQMARAAGIHLIMATQRPSVDVVTGTIKANFPTRVSYHVTSKIDSRTILGEGGAEQLLGKGDLLYMHHGGRITRVHGPFVADDDVAAVTAFLRGQAAPRYVDDVVADPPEEPAVEATATGDELYDRATALVLQERKCSVSFLQRHLAIGYNRAARIVDQMEAEGLVGPANHTGKRALLVS